MKTTTELVTTAIEDLNRKRTQDAQYAIEQLINQLASAQQARAKAIKAFDDEIALIKKTISEFSYSELSQAELGL